MFDPWSDVNIMVEGLKNFFGFASNQQLGRVTSASHTTSLKEGYVGVDYAGAVAITLTTPVTGKQQRNITIKDESGNASVNNITITPTSGLIDGQSSLTINSDYQSYSLIFSKETGNWSIV